MRLADWCGSFRVQLATVCAASVAVLAMAALLIYDALARSRRALLDDARQQCVGAVRELKQQVSDRALYGAEALDQLPLQARELSLRGIADTVLRTYESVEGGFYLTGSGVMGYSFPTAGEPRKDQPTALEQTHIASLAERAQAARGLLYQEGDWGSGLVAAAAEPSAPGQHVAWSMKRLRGFPNTGGGFRQVWLVALAGVGLLGIAAVVFMWYSLRRGIAEVRGGLRRAGNDLSHRLSPKRGEFGEIVESINDMADRRAAVEAELRQQDRLAALGQVVAGVAHEIRNPLNSMRLTLDLLNRRTKRGIACTGEVEDAIRQVDRLNVILSRLLAFGRPPLEDVRTQELGPLVERAVAVVVEQSRQKAVGIQILPIDAQATVDGPQIEQVLVNLLLNALDASPRNGRVEVSGETSNGCVRLRVRDQGPGIPQNSRPRVFDAYYTTKANGTGLGLSVSREIIANHGGSLSFNTGENGTEFWLELPIRRSEA